MTLKNKILEGKFLYLKDGSSYTDEIFTVHKEDKTQGDYFFKSEVLSRVRTGEFLKIYIEYHLNTALEPIKITTRRLLGHKSSLEVFQINHQSRNVYYQFTDSNNKRHEFEKVVNSRAHFATPCFLTSMIMLNYKAIDPVQKTSYQIISTNNIWNYSGPFQEYEIDLELQNSLPINLKINGNELKATHIKMYPREEKSESEIFHDFYLSKYYFIPYKVDFNNGIIIQVDKLKHFEDQFSKK